MTSQIPNKLQKIGYHSHLKNFDSNNSDSPFIIQPQIQKSFSILKKFIRKNYIGKLILLKGPSGSGKTALINALKSELYPEINFNIISASEIYSKVISKTEYLMQNLRKSIGLNIKDNIKIIEGEVVSFNNEKLTLKTLDMESIFDIGEQMLLQIQKERITVGDIIRIVKERGNIIKIGISSSRKTQDFLGDANVVNCPEGEMFKNLEENQKISMHDIDVINDKLYSVIRLYNGETGEISSDTREEVDEIVRKWIMEEKAKIQRGVLCIEEAHMLDDECLNLLVQSIEFGKSPLVILTTNSEDIKNYPKSTLVVSTKEIQKEDLKSIFFEKFKLEEIQLEESALEFIIDVSIKKNISYAINIIHLSKIFCNIKNSEIIKVEDIKRMMNIFYNFQDITELY